MAGIVPYTDESWRKTNADRIRAMSVEKMAEIMVHDCPPNYQHGDCHELDCQQCWLDWLKQEVEEGA